MADDNLMFYPNDRVIYKNGRGWIAGVVVRVSIPVGRVDDLEPVEFFPPSEPQALVRLDDGREVLIPFAELQLAPAQSN